MFIETKVILAEKKILITKLQEKSVYLNLFVKLEKLRKKYYIKGKIFSISLQEN